MTNTRIQILEAAKFHYEKSIKYYNKWETAIKENKDDIALMWWNNGLEQDNMMRGLVEAYNILLKDDHSISWHQINEELQTLYSA